MGINHCASAADAYTVCLAGHPNVGKSTVFNALTGMRQHTGNWSGKTVELACGRFSCPQSGHTFQITDLPGTYSLLPSSAEEELARDAICFGDADAVLIVADATCLERSLIFCLQVLETGRRALLCVNLADEAARKGIHLDRAALQNTLGIPVVLTSARCGQGLPELVDRLDRLCSAPHHPAPACTDYPPVLANVLDTLTPVIADSLPKSDPLSPKWVALRLLEGDPVLVHTIRQHLKTSSALEEALSNAWQQLAAGGIASGDALTALTVRATVTSASAICRSAVSMDPDVHSGRSISRLDRLLTSRKTGIPLMLLMLGAILWLTIAGANTPSALLSNALFALENHLYTLASAIHLHPFVSGLLIEGMYRTVAWVVSVMLPPMAIFFPLFTLLEDAGVLPRIALNLDHCFCRAGAHGKQALTMCMGLGCNACGVTGCRIIDSPRERLIAILTNAFVPCNGRFPTLIALGVLLTAGAAGWQKSLFSAGILTALFVLSVLLTFLASWLLTHTLLRGQPSRFALELPPYRRPQIGRVIVRSICSRTLFVLGRAVSVAAPAGILLWLLANCASNGISLLSWLSGVLSPFAAFFGLDGAILLACLLALPANELFLPILAMIYRAGTSVTAYGSYVELQALFSANGWSAVTLICVLLLTLFHFPCGTTLVTIAHETRSIKWTLLSAVLPCLFGLLLCALVHGIALLI